jgi:hypothetical protein
VINHLIKKNKRIKRKKEADPLKKRKEKESLIVIRIHKVIIIN